MKTSPKVMDMLTKGEKIPIDVEKESGSEGAKGETAAAEKGILEKTAPTPVKEKKSISKKR